MEEPNRPNATEKSRERDGHAHERGMFAAVSIGLAATIAAILASMMVSYLIGGVSRIPFLPLALFAISTFVSAYVSAKARPSSWLPLSCLVAVWWTLWSVLELPLLAGNGPKLTDVGFTGTIIAIAFASAYAGGRFLIRRAA